MFLKELQDKLLGVKNKWENFDCFGKFSEIFWKYLKQFIKKFLDEPPQAKM